MIPVSQPYITSRDFLASLQCLKSGWISGNGPANKEFESRFAASLGVQNCATVSNGSVAIVLALRAIGVTAGDEVIVPSLTFIATANAVSEIGAVPVFCDVDINTWCISYDSVVDKITPKTKAIIFVSLYGNMTGISELAELCFQKRIWLIEDAAESLFASCDRRYSGTIADISTFSFFGNKVLSCGEGGAVTTNRKDLNNTIVALRDQGAIRNRRYQYDMKGFNYRLSNYQASLLLSQFKKRDKILQKRNRIFDKYTESLSVFKNVSMQYVDKSVIPSPWLFTIRIRGITRLERDNLIRDLMQLGIETRPIFAPIHLQGAFAEYNSVSLPNTEKISQEGVSLPTFPSLSRREINKVMDSLRSVAKDFL